MKRRPCARELVVHTPNGMKALRCDREPLHRGPHAASESDDAFALQVTWSHV